jgi:hypothetical protein
MAADQDRGDKGSEEEKWWLQNPLNRNLNGKQNLGADFVRRNSTNLHVTLDHALREDPQDPNDTRFTPKKDQEGNTVEINGRTVYEASRDTTEDSQRKS